MSANCPVVPTSLPFLRESPLLPAAFLRTFPVWTRGPARFPPMTTSCEVKPSARRRLVAPWVRLVRDPMTPYERTALASTDGLIRGPKDVHALLKERASAEEVEVFYLVVLDMQNRVKAVSEVTRGILNSSLVHPREVFRLAVAYGAASIIVAHNHPSGDPTPSADDRDVTRQLVDAGRTLDIPVLDHVVLAGERYTSFAEAGLLMSDARAGQTNLNPRRE